MNNTCIYCFSGTGNSRRAAAQISEVTCAPILSLNEQIRSGASEVSEAKDLIFVTPTYAWRIPRIVEKWIRDAALPEGSRAWFVMTCGGQIGNAAEYNKLLAEEKHFTYMGTAGIVMPENYIAMFHAPAAPEANAIIAKAEPDIRKAAGLILSGEPLPAPRRNIADRLMSGPINPLFYRFAVKAGPFYAKDSCISCGKCEDLCPLHNISMKDGRPAWGRTCTHCMACICHCPTEAIEYGKKSEGKPRYHID